MDSYDKCIKFESEKPKGMIRLVEANGFYRAYNHSAYVFHQVIAQHKVTKKFVKNINQEIVYVGFPVDKLLERHKANPMRNGAVSSAHPHNGDPTANTEVTS